jgi:methyltransferase family protein
MKVDLQQLYRVLVSSPYYRLRPDRIARLLHAKWMYARHRAATPAQWLEHSGIDCASALRDFERWRGTLQGVIARVAEAAGEQGGVSIEDGVVLYALARALSPDHVIETGVAAGVSTAFLAAALIDNAHGELYSIELPPAEVENTQQADGARFDWPRKGIGWVVPQSIRRAIGARHTVILQDVRTALPRLLASLPHVDLFVHDDLHTPEHMLWEYRQVWPNVRVGGILVSDDVNEGWIQFCREASQPVSGLYNIQRLAALRKISSSCASQSSTT